jgi:hypothetical protein
MKKLILITGMIIAISFLADTVNAQTTQSADKTSKIQTTQTDQRTPGNFVDENGDGICDNSKNSNKQGKCAKFVDENGDGVCDNCKGKGNCCNKGIQKGKCTEMKSGNCCSKGKGNQHRHGQKNCQPSSPTQPDKK